MHIGKWGSLLIATVTNFIKTMSGLYTVVQLSARFRTATNRNVE
jgi:hypothetical protein